MIHEEVLYQVYLHLLPSMPHRSQWNAHSNVRRNNSLAHDEARLTVQCHRSPDPLHLWTWCTVVDVARTAAASSPDKMHTVSPTVITTVVYTLCIADSTEFNQSTLHSLDNVRNQCSLKTISDYDHSFYRCKIHQYRTRVHEWCHKTVFVYTGAAMAQWSRWWTGGLAPSEPRFNSRWYPYPSVAAGSKGIRPKQLTCASESPTLVPQYLGRHVRVVEQRSQQH